MDQKTWIYIGIAVVVVLAIAFYGITHSKTKPSKITKSNVDLSKLFHAIGGKENLIDMSANGSKVTFTLHQPKAILQEELKALGASGIVASKDKVTVIFGKSSEVLVNEIKQAL